MNYKYLEITILVFTSVASISIVMKDTKFSGPIMLIGLTILLCITIIIYIKQAIAFTQSIDEIQNDNLIE
ncbi:TPA: hypothetical protein ACF0PM_002252 [Clostridium perfringens]